MIAATWIAVPLAALTTVSTIGGGLVADARHGASSRR